MFRLDSDTAFLFKTRIRPFSKTGSGSDQKIRVRIRNTGCYASGDTIAGGGGHVEDGGAGDQRLPRRGLRHAQHIRYCL